MSFPRSMNIPLVLLCLAVFSTQLACSSNRYRQPISKFQAASAVVSADARKTYTEINRLQRAALIRKKARDREDIRLDDLKKVQPLDESDLKARLDALDRLNDYVDLLVSIANSDAPENISKSATDLTGALGNLVNTVNGLGASDKNSVFKTKVNNAFGVASAIVSGVLKAFVQHKIKEGLEKAIRDGEKPVNELIEATAGDLTAFQILNFAVFESERTDFITLYNCQILKRQLTTLSAEELAQISPKQLEKCRRDSVDFNPQLLESYKTQLIAGEDLLETLRAADPAESLSKMKKAHSKIVLLAKTKSPSDFVEVVTAIEDFAAAAKRFGDAVEKLKNS